VVDALTAAPLPAAEARLGPALIRLGRGVLAAPVGGLEAVADAVTAATSDLGRPPGGRPFRGHVTLARSRGNIPAALAAAAVEAEWAVDAVCLVVSHLHPAGARYEVVQRFPVG
jgi:2'-5' RNA ligase